MWGATDPVTNCGGDLLDLKPGVTSTRKEPRPQLNLRKEGPPDYLILALLHKCAATEGPRWQLSGRHSPDGITKTSFGEK